MSHTHTTCTQRFPDIQRPTQIYRPTHTHTHSHALSDTHTHHTHTHTGIHTDTSTHTHTGTHTYTHTKPCGAQSRLSQSHCGSRASMTQVNLTSLLYTCWKASLINSCYKPSAQRARSFSTAHNKIPCKNANNTQDMVWILVFTPNVHTSHIRRKRKVRWLPKSRNFPKIVWQNDPFFLFFVTTKENKLLVNLGVLSPECASCEDSFTWNFLPEHLKRKTR